jgi:hypothetical protein
VPRNEAFDVAALEIQNDSVIAILRNNWQFLELRNIAKPMPMGRALLSGY